MQLNTFRVNQPERRTANIGWKLLVCLLYCCQNHIQTRQITIYTLGQFFGVIPDLEGEINCLGGGSPTQREVRILTSSPPFIANAIQEEDPR